MPRVALVTVVSGLVLLGCTPGRSSTGEIEPPPVEVDHRATERPGADNDPFFGGVAAPTAIALAPGERAAIDGTSDARDENETWADSDGYALALTEGTQLQAELRHAGAGGTWAVAIHRPDRSLVAWWGMGETARALTHPVELPAGEYFVHVAAEPPGPAEPVPYTVLLHTGELGACASSAPADHVERERGAGDNDASLVHWASFPRIEAGSAAAEASGLAVAVGASRVIEGVSALATETSDSYLDRDAYGIEIGAGVHELRVRLEHAPADVNLDVLLLSADGRTLVGTGVEIGDSPELAAFPVVPGERYLLFVGARDERAIGGDTALPLAYRAVVCGRGAP